MKTDDFFETLSDIDDELIANARPVRSPDEIVVRRAPLWKTIAGYAAAAACVAALAVGGIFGIKYFNGRNEVTPPASGSSSDVSYSKSDCMAYTPMEYPAEAKYVYKGDYGELDYSHAINVDAEVYSSYKKLAALSDLIVSGQFTDLAHQTADPDLPYASSEEMSFNTFYIDQVVKGDKKSGDAIAIGQFCTVHEGMIYSDPMAPMVCGDRWIYFLEERDGYYMPVSCVQGRYPIPFNRNKELKKCGDYGYYYGSNCCENDPGTSTIYLQTLNEFGLAVTQNFNGVILSVMTDKNSYKQGDEIKVTATVLNTTDKPIGLLMPVQGENSHTEISTWIGRAERYLPDISVSGVFATAMDSHIVEPGGEYVQEMTFGTFYHYYEKPEDAMPGIYKGIAGISLLAEPNNTGSETTHHKIDFELEITGDKNIQPPVETIADYYGGQMPQMPEGIVKFTMPEFPGTEFEIRNMSVLADGEQLFGGYPVYNVYLCDLNGDGKREIISCCHGTNYKLLESDVIKICDYADGGKLYYFADDPFFYDDHLTIEDGSLIVVRTTKPGYSTEPEDILQPLTFDKLEAYYVRPENAPAPVENYDRLDDLSRMEDSRLFYLEYYCENENEPVYSTVNGTVYDAGYSIAFGNFIVVIGDDGCSYCFGSMKNTEPFVEIGDKVTAGQQIGIVGSTGDWPYGTVGVRYFCSLGDIIIKHVD